MKAFEITDLKTFMAAFLTTPVFDHYLLEEATITTYNIFRIDGRIRTDFYTEEDQENNSLSSYEFSAWKDMRLLCFNLIKGKRIPLQFKFVLHLMPSKRDELLSPLLSATAQNSIRALTLTARFENNTLTLMTGMSTASFSLDREPELIWDRTFGAFLSDQKIPFEEL